MTLRARSSSTGIRPLDRSSEFAAATEGESAERSVPSRRIATDIPNFCDRYDKHLGLAVDFLGSSAGSRTWSKHPLATAFRFVQTSLRSDLVLLSGTTNSLFLLCLLKTFRPLVKYKLVVVDPVL